MRLNDIRITIGDAWVWGCLEGGNGGVVGKGRLRHLFPIKRGEPPAIVEEDNTERPAWGRNVNWARQMWRPYAQNLIALDDDGYTKINRAAIDAALCKKVKTTAHWVRIGIRHWGAQGNCPDCQVTAERMGIKAYDWTTLQREDPWTQMIPNPYAQNEDWRNPDPVTGG